MATFQITFQTIANEDEPAIVRVIEADSLEEAIKLLIDEVGPINVDSAMSG